MQFPSTGRYSANQIVSIVKTEIRVSQRRQREAKMLEMRWRHRGREMGLRKALRLLAKLEI